MPNSVNSRNLNENAAEFYQQLRVRDQRWLDARQRLIRLKERQMFWFGDNSLIMWLLWQLFSYVLVAIVLMLLNKFLSVQLTLWQFITVFAVQTLIFLGLFIYKGKLAQGLQQRIHKEELAREQAFNEMTTLAEDSIFPDIHAITPISLKDIYERYEAQLHIVSLQHLLQNEIDAGRLVLGQQKKQRQTLPLDLADDELAIQASSMIYRSVV